MDIQDFSKPIYIDGEAFPTHPTVEFTEDCWNTTYLGYCSESTIYSYKVISSEYGTFWIPKSDVRLYEKKYT